MWYVIQTVTGKEQELVDAIERILSGEGQKYSRCFVIYREFVWRLGGRHKLQAEPLFPSYVFVETDVPEEFFLELKRVPKLSKLLGLDGCFWSIYQEEEEFLKCMLEEGESAGGEGCLGPEDSDSRVLSLGDINRLKHGCLVRRSLVRVDKEGKIIEADGVLGRYMDRMVKQRLRKRSVVIEVSFLGRMRRVQLGIRLEGDEGWDDHTAARNWPLEIKRI